MDLRKITARMLYSDEWALRVARHLLLFVSMNVLFTLIALTRAGEGQPVSQVACVVFVNSIFFFGYAYITAFVLVPVMLTRRQIVAFIVSFLFAGILISYLKFVFSDYVFYDQVIAGDFARRLTDVNWPRIVTNTKDMTFIVAIFLIAKYAKDNHAIRIKLHELREARLESELKVLSSQMDPHVLFNNLNNLYAISIGNPDRVLFSIRNLRELLHYYFVDGKSGLIPLTKEIGAMQAYLAMEQLRYGDRLNVEFRVQGETAGKTVVPFVLFTFLENCFEHSFSAEAGNAWLKMSVLVDRNAIEYRVSNSKPPASMGGHAGPATITPESRKKQFDRLYPGKYQLIVEESNEKYDVFLKLKTK